jgi:rhamnulokinase
MKEAASPETLPPHDPRAVVAVDLGAESCRVSLLRWNQHHPEILIVQRFPNGPVQRGAELHWDLDAIWAAVQHGLAKCAALAPEGIASVAVDGWAVDYVRLNQKGNAVAPPFCYRDMRTEAAAKEVHQKISMERLYELTGVQYLRFNTLYQLYADKLSGHGSNAPWINLPEYVLHKLGARRVSEYTNATHTGLVDVRSREWCEEIFLILGLEIATAPELVLPGTVIGELNGHLTELPTFRDTRLIAPACHDTASAIAGIPKDGNNWAYISSGTWSLVGTVLPRACIENEAYKHNFTNLGAAGGNICFHTSVNGMWLIKQCLQFWSEQGHSLEISEVIAAAERLPAPVKFLNVDDPELLLPGKMPARINHQRRRDGLEALSESPSAAPMYASLIFHSLADRYAQVLSNLRDVTGHELHEIYVVGGGSRNDFLNRLTKASTGLRVTPGHVESSTIGNFAIQLAALNQAKHEEPAPSADEVCRWTQVLENIACVDPV